MNSRSTPLRAAMAETGPTLMRSSQDPLDLHALMQSLITPETAVACVLTGTIGHPDDTCNGAKAGGAKRINFPRLVDAEVRRVVEKIRKRWPSVVGIGIVQRIGSLEPGMQVLMIACTSAEYDETLWDAAQFGMDRLGPGLIVIRGAIDSVSGHGVERRTHDVENGERT